MNRLHLSRDLRDMTRSPVEEIRVAATIMVITYHVIGLPDTGMNVPAGHVLRRVSDCLSLVQMPAFALIAGFVFCIRPPTIATFGRFFRKKLLRLAVPGTIAALLFAFVSSLFHRRYGVPPEEWWRILLFPYAHFWFIQAILVLFTVIGFADAVLKGRWTWLLLLCTLALCFSPWPFLPSIMSLPRAMQLAPFFITGMLFYRYGDWLRRRQGIVTTLSLLSLLAGFVLFANQASPPPDTMFLHVGTVWPTVQALSSLLIPIAAWALLLFYCPHHPQSRRVGQLTLTVYLYHVFGTAGIRTLLEGLGVTSMALHLPLGILSGFLLPVFLHLVLARIPWAAAIFLGIWPTAKARPSPGA